MHDAVWPPAYTIKMHARAKRVKLKISSRKGLEFIVPPRFNQRQIPALLEEHKTWIEKQLQYYNDVKIKRDDDLPTQVMLHAIQQNWHVQYMKTKLSSVKLYLRPNHELVMLGGTQNKLICKKLLLSWLRKQAQCHLIPWLNELSHLTKLPFNNVSIRSQQQRWGSCSSDHDINLNDQLLFLPSRLVSYVMIHELCHTIHLNHSRQFWELVAQFDVEYIKHKAELRDVKKYIPDWIR